MNDQKGFTLVGVLIASVIICTIAFGATELIRVNAALLAKTKQQREMARVIGNVLNHVIENLASLQRTFETSVSTREALLREDRLPFAWDQSSVVPAEQCPTCPGRMGYIIEPLPGRPSFSRLTIRITNAYLFQGYRDYVYILADD